MILDDIANAAKLRVARSKAQISLDTIRRNAETVAASEHAVRADEPLRFERALRAPKLSFICEVKRASPSKGLIAEDFPYLDIAAEYEDAGAAAISVLTEPDFFKGCNSYLAEIAQTVSVPVLRKDFIIDAYQIYEAKLLGASAILLIVSLLDTETLEEFMLIARMLRLDALVEAHDELEVRNALAAGARIIGVNNRDLKTFTVDLRNSLRLRSCVPRDKIFVAESGISTAADIAALRAAGVDAALIGEAMMRSSDKKAFLAQQGV
ncbi:MAG: indole-3-glycerol phosphate synthase TrpC [Spirochaetaceae bacterium]|jgi:indole-3-glycerol phosphate synthase|nr:indole-3-glycerol phosphate synthase TrpC [Spirochaetaceae bacterium]